MLAERSDYFGGRGEQETEIFGQRYADKMPDRDEQRAGQSGKEKGEDFLTRHRKRHALTGGDILDGAE